MNVDRNCGRYDTPYKEILPDPGTGGVHHYDDVTMSLMASQTPAPRLFTQPFIQTQIKENIKAPRHWPLCGEFTGTGEFPAQRASYAENVSIWWRHHEDANTQTTKWFNFQMY